MYDNHSQATRYRHLDFSSSVTLYPTSVSRPRLLKSRENRWSTSGIIRVVPSEEHRTHCDSFHVLTRVSHHQRRSFARAVLFDYRLRPGNRFSSLETRGRETSPMTNVHAIFRRRSAAIRKKRSRDKRFDRYLDTFVFGARPSKSLHGFSRVQVTRHDNQATRYPDFIPRNTRYALRRLIQNLRRKKLRRKLLWIPI